jgi:NADH-quinone oxidoreductase subunit N
LMVEVFQRSRAPRSYHAWLASLFLAAAGLDSLYLLARGTDHVALGGMVVVDSYSAVFNLIFVTAGIFGALISPSYLANHAMARGEYYALMLFSVCGMMVMASALDLFALFMGLELMSIPIYCIAGFLRQSSRSAESSMKYFILGAFASAFFLYGISFLYGLTGTTDLQTIGAVFTNHPSFSHTFAQPSSGLPVRELTMLPGLAMLLVLAAFAFKIAAVPFHMWTPDVYSGAPTPAVGFMSTAVKAAAFAGLIRVFTVAFYDDAARTSGTGWIIVLYWLAIFSVVLGNLAAMPQRNLKRMLAYSSIAHAGYILIGLLGAAYQGHLYSNMEAVVYYLASYTFGTLGAFGVLAYLGKRGEEALTLEDIAGLAKRHPGAAFAMTLFMLSSAGVPPTAGFVAKFFAFKAAVQTGQPMFVVLALVGALGSVAGAYYYLKVIAQMYMREPRREVEAVSGPEIRFALVACAAAVLLLGLVPAPLLDLARAGVVGTHGLPLSVRAHLMEPPKPTEPLELPEDAPEMERVEVQP